MKRAWWMFALTLATAVIVADDTVAFGQKVTTNQEDAQKPKPSVVRSVSFSPDGKRLAVALEDADKTSRLVVFDVTTRRPQLVHHEETAIWSVAFAPNGRTLAIGHVAPQVKLLDADLGGVVKTLTGHEQHVRSVAYSSDGNRLITAGDDRTVKIWNVATGNCHSTFTGHMQLVTSAAMAQDGSFVVSCSYDGTTRIWNPETAEELQVLKPTPFAVSHVAFSPDGRFFATSRNDGLVRIRESKTRLLRARISAGGGAEISADGRTLAAIGQNFDVQLFDIDLAEPAPELSRRIDALIARWDDDDFAVRETASSELAKIGMLAESQLHKAMESESAEVRIRARRTHSAVWSPPVRTLLTGHTAGVTCIAFSPIDTLLASGDRAGEVKFWDIATGKNLATLSDLVGAEK